MISGFTIKLIHLFHIHLNIEKSKELLKLNDLFHMIVNVEPHKHLRKAAQCFSCQSIYHISRDLKKNAGGVVATRIDSRGYDEIHKPINVQTFFKNCNRVHPSCFEGCSSSTVTHYLCKYNRSFAEIIKRRRKIHPSSKTIQVIIRNSKLPSQEKILYPLKSLTKIIRLLKNALGKKLKICHIRRKLTSLMSCQKLRIKSHHLNQDTSKS